MNKEFFISTCHTSLAIQLHRLPDAADIKFKSWTLAYRVIAGSAPTYLNACQGIHYPRSVAFIRRASSGATAAPARQSRLLSFVVPPWWNELPRPPPPSWRSSWRPSSPKSVSSSFAPYTSPPAISSSRVFTSCSWTSASTTALSSLGSLKNVEQ